MVRGYYAIQNTLFPAIYSTIGVIISLPIYMIGMNLVGARGVALAISMSAILQVILLYALWNRRSHNPESRKVYRGYVKMLLLTIPAGLMLEGLRMGLAQWIGMKGLAGSLLIAGSIGLIFLLLLFAAGYLFKIKEITESLGRLFKKAI